MEMVDCWGPQAETLCELSNWVSRWGGGHVGVVGDDVGVEYKLCSIIGVEAGHHGCGVVGILEAQAGSLHESQ